MSMRFALCGLAALAAAPACAQSQPTHPRLPGEIPSERTDAPPVTAIKLILVGDSTVASGSGWGGAFCAAHVAGEVACLNLAKGGRSSRSYRQEGSWAFVENEMRVKGYAQTYVLIQFAHNDQSSAPERWTHVADEFPANLARYVTEVRAAGAVPVLVTPLSRRDFRRGKLYDILQPWADQVRHLAAAMQTPLVDLNADSARYLEEVGPVAATDLAQAPPQPADLTAARTGTTLPRRAPSALAPYGPAVPATGPSARMARSFDYTHLGDKGAQVFARQVAVGLAVAVPDLRGKLLP